MKFLNNTKSLVNLALMIFLFLASYYLLLTIEFKIEDREKFNFCLEQARPEYKELWNSQCKRHNKSEDCGLPSDIGAYLNSNFIEQKSVCAKLYR